MTLEIILLVSSLAFAQVNNTNPLQVDTSVSDIKPVKQFDPAPKKEYRPTFDVKGSFGYTQAESEFRRQQKADMDQSARNTTP